MSDIYYLERTKNGTNAITLKSKLFENRIIFLDSQINVESVNTTIAQISLLVMENPDEPITILINSPGGSILNGMVLIDVMQACPCTIQTVSLGIAASMGAVILAAGTKGHRFVSPNSQVMVHQPLIAGGIPGGNCIEIESVENSLIKTKNEIDQFLSKLTGKSIKSIRKLTGKDTYMSAEEALKNGLVDKIATAEELNSLLTGGIAI
ncbi:MAG: ATP-dependent Clp protease proteolytic subunit [Clostridia bacterium]|nr:ATP-dependent Clp protease proteolytic subunit [Clostridia bacterium]